MAGHSRAMVVLILAAFVCVHRGTTGTPAESPKLLSIFENQWCDQVLGCLSNDGWTSLNRPINLLPHSRATINTSFYLHTRAAPNQDVDYTVLASDLTSLNASPFDASKPTKFIVHGFLDNGRKFWLKTVASGLLNDGDYNVIRVDWGDGSLPPYEQAASNTRVVGLEIGHLVNTLISTKGVNPSLVHCMGHSLGSHICGFAGEKINKLGRITGLDPAGPYFTGTPDFVHLDPTDATFVDAIHTDADPLYTLGYGTPQPMGHLDFYPNLGRNQPGCLPTTIAVDVITADMMNDLGSVFACNHQRAINYFINTLVGSQCQWLAHECSDAESFAKGNCFSCGTDNSNCAYMGLRADQYVSKSSQFVKMYLNTSGDQPYCMNHYEVSILTANPSDAKPYVTGRVSIALYGDNQEVINLVPISDEHERIDHGGVKRLMFISSRDVGHVQKVELSWSYDGSLLGCLLGCNKSLYVKSVEVSSINHYPETERQNYTSLTCSADGTTTQITDGQTQTFQKGAACQHL